MNNLQPRTACVDGDFFLSRVLHIPDFVNMISDRGEPSGGAYGMLQTLLTTLKRFPGIKKCIVCWDTGRSARRMTLLPEYKANRKREGDEEYAKYKLFYEQQKTLCQAMLPAFGTRVAMIPCAEGDDILGWFARNLEEDLVICTEDKDLLQLVNKHTAVFQPIKEQFVSLGNFSQVAGCVKPLFLVRKAIMGDVSDNIDGVKSMGATCTKRLMEVATDYLAQRRANTGRDLLRLAVESLVQTDTRNRKRYLRVLENQDLVSRNMKLMDVKLEVFSEAEELTLRHSLDSGAGQFDEREALGFLERMSFKKFIDTWGSFSRPFRRLS